MSMEINGSYGYSKVYDAKQPEEARLAKQAEKAEKAAEKKAPAGQDAYISREQSAAKPSGLYRVEPDENGNRKIVFDDPKKPQTAPDAQKKSEEKCVANTDQVDNEIKKLKEKQKQLEQQIQSASAAGDEKKVRELEKQLAQVQSELSQKDNDTYRRQHSSFSQ